MHTHLVNAKTKSLKANLVLNKNEAQYKKITKKKNSKEISQKEIIIIIFK